MKIIIILMFIFIILLTIMSIYVCAVLTEKLNENDKYLESILKSNEMLSKENDTLMAVIEISDKQIKELEKKVK